MDYSIPQFLEENEVELIEQLKDRFYHNLNERLELSGYYREAYDTRLKMKMRALLMKDLGLLFNLDAEQQLMLESEQLEKIINRSIYE